MQRKHWLPGFLALVLFLVGCGEPSAEDRLNRRLLDAVLTAISMKNGRWLERDAQLLQQRREAGQLSEAAFRDLHSVIGKARAGDWAGAEADAYRFRERYPFCK